MPATQKYALIHKRNPDYVAYRERFRNYQHAPLSNAQFQVAYGPTTPYTFSDYEPQQQSYVSESYYALNDNTVVPQQPSAPYNPDPNYLAAYQTNNVCFDTNVVQIPSQIPDSQFVYNRLSSTRGTTPDLQAQDQGATGGLSAVSTPLDQTHFCPPDLEVSPINHKLFPQSPCAITNNLTKLPPKMLTGPVIAEYAVRLNDFIKYKTDRQDEAEFTSAAELLYPRLCSHAVDYDECPELYQYYRRLYGSEFTDNFPEPTEDNTDQPRQPSPRPGTSHNI